MDNNILILILLFISWLGLAVYVHDANLRFIDDYMRLIYLFPLFYIFSNCKVSLENEFIKVIKISSVCAVLHFIYTYYYVEYERYGGTSSIVITYSYLLATMMILSIFFFFKGLNKSPDYFLIFSSLAFFLIYVQTGTKGLIPGIIICILLILYWFRPKKTIIFSIFLPLVYIYSISDISHRMQQTIAFIEIYTSSDTDIKNSKAVYRGDESTYTRIKLIEYGIDIIKEKPLLGLGPQRLEKDLYSKMKDYNMRTTIKFGHLHNDFIDIAVKFGIPSLLLLILIYFLLAKKFMEDKNQACLLILVMFIIGQMTQSHFTHNQSIVFFITTLFCLSGQMKSTLKGKVTK
tara:strand:- start:230 stop:1270 length:1041 start_codon:yes stop_codon:yes gene_type:complete